MVPLVLGLLLAFIAIAMAKDLKLPLRAFALALAALPAFYMMFALLVGDLAALGLELLYGLPFIGIGILCYRRGFKASGFLVAALWALHAAYDVYHPMLVANAGVPGWYPVLCLGFDILIVSYLIGQVVRLPNFDIFPNQTSQTSQSSRD